MENYNVKMLWAWPTFSHFKMDFLLMLSDVENVENSFSIQFKAMYKREQDSGCAVCETENVTEMVEV